MDVLAGAAVMQGPSNVVGPSYNSAPVTVTVEGANIMTRTLMIFGQGATRCHPYAYNVVQAVESNDKEAFRENLTGWLKQFSGTIGMSWVRGLTRGFGTVNTANAPPKTKTYVRRLGWSITRFGLMTNLAMFLIGGKLKMRGNLTGRYADALAWMYVAISAIRRFDAEGRKPEDLPLVQYSCEYSLAKVQEAYEGMYSNFDGAVGLFLKTIGRFLLSVNPIGKMPTDKLTRAAALTIQKYDEQYLRVAQGQLVPKDTAKGMGRLLDAFRQTTEAEPIRKKIRAAQKSRTLDRGKAEEVSQQAVEKAVITQAERDQLLVAEQACLVAIEVDVFTKAEFYGEEANPGQSATGRGGYAKDAESYDESIVISKAS